MPNPIHSSLNAFVCKADSSINVAAHLPQKTNGLDKLICLTWNQVFRKAASGSHTLRRQRGLMLCTKSKFLHNPDPVVRCPLFLSEEIITQQEDKHTSKFPKLL